MESAHVCYGYKGPFLVVPSFPFGCITLEESNEYVFFLCPMVVEVWERCDLVSILEGKYSVDSRKRIEVFASSVTLDQLGDYVMVMWQIWNGEINFLLAFLIRINVYWVSEVLNL